MKPRIRKERSLWICYGMDVEAMGNTPEAAHYGWVHALYDKQVESMGWFELAAFIISYTAIVFLAAYLIIN